MKKALLTLAIIVSSISSQASNLPLHASHQYRYLGIVPIFHASLHLPTDYERAVFDAQKPLDLVFRYYRDISKDQLIEQARTALTSAHGEAELQRFSASLDRINAAYQDVTRGDEYRLNYQPGRGLSLYLNTKKQLNLADAEFSSFYLTIWLGHETTESKLSKKLWADLNKQQEASR